MTSFILAEITALSYDEYREALSEQLKPKVREPASTVKRKYLVFAVIIFISARLIPMCIHMFIASFKRCFFKYSPHTCNQNEYCDSNKVGGSLIHSYLNDRVVALRRRDRQSLLCAS